MAASVLFILVVAAAANSEMVANYNYNHTTLRCLMDMSCQKKETCELPCKMITDTAKADDPPSVPPGKTTSEFIDEEFEELWDEMQNEMKELNEHQAELIAQQNDLFGQQKKLEKENRNLKEKQSDLLSRQEFLEKENERLKALIPETDDDSELRAKIRELEAKINVITTQQKKLTSQQNRLVQRQNRLMARQTKLEKENKMIRQKQARMEKNGFAHTTTVPVQSTDIKGGQPPAELQEKRIETRFEALKREMETKINQLTGQQEELLREQTKLINRQSRLEDENEELKSQQDELFKKQEELEKENQALRMNLTYRTDDPEEKRDRVKESGLCAVEYKKFCFGLLGDGSDELTYDLAQENCEQYGGNLANIYDLTHYDKLKVYFLNQSVSSGVWLGMTYNPINYNVYNFDGSLATFEKWNWIYPVSFAAYTAIYLYVDSVPDSMYSGMVNLPPTWKYPYALCQFGAKE